MVGPLGVVVLARRWVRGRIFVGMRAVRDKGPMRWGLFYECHIVMKVRNET